MKLTIGSWNVADYGAGDKIDAKLVQYILSSNVDIWLLCEGCPPTVDRVVRESSLEAYAGVYDVCIYNYNDIDRRRDEHCYIVLVRRTLVEQGLVKVDRVHQADTRDFVRVLVDDLTIFGMHFDDRKWSERHYQAVLISEAAPKPPILEPGAMNLMVIGDFNTAPRHTLLGMVLNLAITRWLMARLPTPAEPGVPVPPAVNAMDWLRQKLARVHSLAERLAGMTNRDGGIISDFERTGLRRVDKSRQATMLLKLGPLSLPVVRLDHAMVSERIKVSSAEVGRPRGVKPDHRPIQMSIEW